MGQMMTVERLVSQLTKAYQSYESVQPNVDLCNQTSGNLSCELMTHPGFPSASTDFSDPDGFSTSIDRQHELNVLTASELKTFYKNFNINLVSHL